MEEGVFTSSEDEICVLGNKLHQRYTTTMVKVPMLQRSHD